MRHAVVRKTKLVKQQASLHPGPADCDEGLAQGSHPTVAKAQLRAIDFNTEQRLGETKRVERGRELRGRHTHRAHKQGQGQQRCAGLPREALACCVARARTPRKLADRNAPRAAPRAARSSARAGR